MALIIDYGYSGPALGDTLQAVRGHGFAKVLDNVGDADLTAHVDFTALANAADKIGLKTVGPVTQRDFLMELGMAERAKALKQNANSSQIDSIDAAFERLTGEEHMGTLFKVLALVSTTTSFL